MKHRLIDLLACPECGAHPLDITILEADADPQPEIHGQCRCELWCAFQKEAAALRSRPCGECYSREVVDGILHCGRCAAEFPIIDGVPRFNPDVTADYPDFFRRYGSCFRNPGRADPARFNALHEATKRSFGFQWLRYQVTTHEEDRAVFLERTLESPSTLKGKLFFEAGCGMGRYLKVIGDEPSAEVVGLDLSLAVNRARAESRANPFVHVIQGNIMELPLRPETFDHVYSIGVLHHTPNTRSAFLSILKLSKPRGRVSVWLYHTWRYPGLRGFRALHATITGWISDGLRVVTRRLPFKVLHAFCHVAVPLGGFQNWIRRSPAIVRVLLSPALLITVSPHPDRNVRILDTFDWYSPRFQWKHTIPEVEGWFREAGLAHIDSKGAPVSVRGSVPQP